MKTRQRPDCPFEGSFGEDFSSRELRVKAALRGKDLTTASTKYNFKRKINEKELSMIASVLADS